MGVQLVITLGIAGPAALVATQFGRSGAIAAVMMLSLPVAAFQASPRVVLTRDLLFARIALTDLVASIVYYSWSIAGAALGMGAWAMATGDVARTTISTVLLVAMSPLGWIWPSLRNTRRLAPTIRFGIRFQLSWITHVVREHVLNLLTGVILGVAALGVWSLAARLMQLPLVLFQSVWQVSFPAMSHVLASRRDPVPILEHVTGVAAIVGVLVLVPFASAAPEIVPAVFGDQWREVGMLVPLSSLGLLLVGPVSVASTGYLYAADEPGAVLRTTVISSLIMIPVGVAAMPSLGVLALGLSSVVNGGVEAVLLSRSVHRSCGARLMKRAAPPTAIGSIAGLIGVGISTTGGDTLSRGILGAVVGLAVLIAGLSIACRTALKAAISTGLDAVRSVRPSSVSAT